MKKLAILAFASLPLAASAQLFSDNFDSDHTSAWKFNSSVAGDTATNGVNNEANFFFDYSTVGIPSAPRSTGGSTIGMKLQANVFGTTTGVFSGMSASPIGKSFTGNYTLSFDSWLNFQGPATGANVGPGGSGTTQAMLAGVGGTDNVTQFPGGTINGVAFAGTVDGGANQDYRLYNASTTMATPASGAYAAGTSASPSATEARNSGNVYYSSFTGSVPAAQTTYAASLGFNNQKGNTDAGDLGFAWRRWDITKMGTTVTWSIDGKLIATATNVNPAGSNIFLGFFDTNATLSGDAYSKQLLFGLVDNVTVQAVPEPGTMAVLGLGAAALLRRRKKA